MEYYDFYNAEYISSLKKRKRVRSVVNANARLIWVVGGVEREELAKGNRKLMYAIKADKERSGNYSYGKLQVVNQ